MKQQVMKWRGGIGMEDLFEQRPVFKGDGFGIGARGAAGLSEQVVPGLFLDVAKEGRSDEDADLFYPGIAEIRCFLRIGGRGKAEGGVVGFQIELQEEGGGDGRLDSDDQVIPEGEVDDEPRDADVEMACTDDRYGE